MSGWESQGIRTERLRDAEMHGHVADDSWSPLKRVVFLATVGGTLWAAIIVLIINAL